MFQLAKMKRIKKSADKILEVCEDLRFNPTIETLLAHPLLLRHRPPSAEHVAPTHKFRMGNELGDLEFHLNFDCDRPLKIRVVGTYDYEGFWLETSAAGRGISIGADHAAPGPLTRSLLEEFKRRVGGIGEVNIS